MAFEIVVFDVASPLLLLCRHGHRLRIRTVKRRTLRADILPRMLSDFTLKMYLMHIIIHANSPNNTFEIQRSLNQCLYTTIDKMLYR